MEDMKTFSVKIPKEIWLFLKKAAIDQERSMADVITECLSKYRNKLQKRLTSGNQHD